MPYHADVIGSLLRPRYLSEARAALAAGQMSNEDFTADKVFSRSPNFDVFLLEYDDERSGSFEPLASVPDDKVVVLGLVSSKVAELEPAEELIARIDEAARYVDRERLALSTQCGFSPVSIGGNLVSEETQERKLELVAEVAHKVW